MAAKLSHPRMRTMETMMAFLISGLPVAPFAPLFELPDQSLATRGIIRRTADKRPGFPCRVSLRDADIGESVLLLNYEHLRVPSPYRSRHAIYVREHATEYQPKIDEIPEVLQIRLLSVRAFDNSGMMVNADVVDGVELASVIHRYFEDQRTEYIHLHNAKPGCFAARVDRA
jgi:Protein of unknown function (DUF1203)